MTALSVFVGVLGAFVAWIALFGVVSICAMRSKWFVRKYIKLIRRIQENAEEVVEGDWL